MDARSPDPVLSHDQVDILLSLGGDVLNTLKLFVTPSLADEITNLPKHAPAKSLDDILERIFFKEGTVAGGRSAQDLLRTISPGAGAEEEDVMEAFEFLGLNLTALELRDASEDPDGIAPPAAPPAPDTDDDSTPEQTPARMYPEMLVPSEGGDCALLPGSARIIVVARSKPGKNPVTDAAEGLGLPALADPRKLALLIVTHYLPGGPQQLGARTYLERRLGLCAYQRDSLAAWVADRPALSARAWGSLLDTIGAELPDHLADWYPYPARDRRTLALALSQPNTLELLGAAVPAPGRAVLRHTRAARAAVAVIPPDLGPWIVQQAFALGAIRSA